MIVSRYKIIFIRFNVTESQVTSTKSPVDDRHPIQKHSQNIIASSKRIFSHWRDFVGGGSLVGLLSVCLYMCCFIVEIYQPMFKKF